MQDEKRDGTIVFLSVDSVIIEEAIRMLKAHQDDKETKLGAEALKAKLSELEKLRQKRESLLNMRLEGEIDKEYFMKKKAELDTREETLAGEIQKLAPKVREKDETVSPEKKLEDLKQQLEKYTDFNGMDAIPETVIEAFTKKIIVSDKGFDWYLRFRKMDKPLEEKIGKRKSKDDYSMVYSFTLTIEDAKAYVYQFSKKRRVLNWRNITVNLWI